MPSEYASLFIGLKNLRRKSFLSRYNAYKQKDRGINAECKDRGIEAKYTDSGIVCMPYPRKLIPKL